MTDGERRAAQRPPIHFPGRVLPRRVMAGYPSRMYAIAFDLDQQRLREHCPGKQGYADIGKFLVAHDFGHQQGSVYCIEENNNPTQGCSLTNSCTVRTHDTASTVWRRAWRFSRSL